MSAVDDKTEKRGFMNTYNVTAENGITRINDHVKNEILALIMPALIEKYGVNEVRMARTEKNVLAIKAGKLTEKGFEYDLCFTIDVTAKSYKEKKTKNGTVEPFDFEYATNEYEIWLDEKEKKEAERKSKREKGGTGAKSKTKREKEQALAEKSAELDKIAEKVAEKRAEESKKAIENAKKITKTNN